MVSFYNQLANITFLSQ